MAEYEDRYWSTADGLRLHFRDYPGPVGAPPVVCLPGLSGNARNFESLAARLAGRWRVLCPSLRGRGDSDYARDPGSYALATYLQDIAGLLEQHAIGRFVPVGTSLGGILTMHLAAAEPERIAGAVINDVGVELEPAGIARIRGYLGQGRSFETWMHAARALQEAHGALFPEYGIEEWLTHAKRAMTLGSNGRIVFDYDMRIAEAFALDKPGDGDLWPCWLALAGRPLLLLRGEMSDILSAENARLMVAAVDTAELVTVPRVGHSPSLDEPQAIAGIERLLAKVS